MAVRFAQAACGPLDRVIGELASIDLVAFVALFEERVLARISDNFGLVPAACVRRSRRGRPT
jgi:hypothetical protein